MENVVIEIVPFRPEHQPGVDDMLMGIAKEFEENFFSPGHKQISELYNLPGRYYWVALAEGKVVGTVGILLSSGHYAVLKSMFLDKTYRGEALQIAGRFLQTAVNQAKELGCVSMYLGTMDQFRGAQRFYEKNGFERTEEEELPADYPGNNFDTVFYGKKII